MKIVSTGRTISSPEFHQKKRRARRKKLLAWASVILAALIALVLLSRVDKIRIKNVEVDGAKVISPEAVKSAVLDAIGGYYLWVIPKDNAILYSSSKVERALAERFPRFSSIGVSLTDSQTLSVSVVEREPYALYCGSEERIDESSPCYFIDEQGFVFDAAPAFSQGVYFVYASSSPALDPLGMEYMPRALFDDMNAFIEELKALGVYPVSLLDSPDSYTLSLSNQAKIIWNKSDDLAGVYSNLSSFLSSPEIKVQSDFLNKLTELDLRTQDKVFYRLKE